MPRPNVGVVVATASPGEDQPRQGEPPVGPGLAAVGVERRAAGEHRGDGPGAGRQHAGIGRSAPQGRAPRGQRWYAWSWLATASAQHCLLIRRHLGTGELAFHYCFVPEGQPLTLTRLIRAAGLRWPVEEEFRPGKDCSGLDESQVRLYTAIARHTVLVMAALAICAVSAALLRGRTDTQAPPPLRPDQPPAADPGMIPMTVPEIMRVLTTQPARPGHAGHWVSWQRRHQARARWYHQRTRLARDTEIALASQ